MKFTMRTIMEQELYGINENATLVGNGDEFIAESILEYLETDDPDYTLMGSLYESIQYSNEYAVYAPLLEAVDNIKEAEDSMKKYKETRDPKEAEAAVKKTITNVSAIDNWFFKVDPEKQSKNMHKILMVYTHIAGALDVGALCVGAGAAAIGGVAALGTGMVGGALLMTLYVLVYGFVAKLFIFLNNLFKKRAIEINKPEFEEDIERWQKQIDENNEKIEKFRNDPNLSKEGKKNLKQIEKANKDLENAIRDIKRVVNLNVK